MKKIFTRSMAALIVVLMLLTNLPAGVFAADEYSLTVDKAGVYPVKVTYFGDVDSRGEISLSKGEDTYKIKYPIYSGQEEYYVIDMNLDAGENSFELARTGAELIGLSVYDGIVRHFEGEELSTKEPADVLKDGSLLVQMPNLPQNVPAFTDANGNVVTIGQEISYYAPSAGSYTIKLRYWGNTGSYATPLIYINSLSNKYTGPSNKEGEGTYTLTVNLSAGLNKLYILCGGWNNAAGTHLPQNSLNLWVDYVDITAPKQPYNITLNTDSMGVYGVKVDYLIEDGNNSPITIKTNDIIYGAERIINFPVVSGKTESYVVDMMLTAGANVVTVDPRVTGLSIYDGATRRFEAEEIAPDAKYKADQANDGSVFVTPGTLSAESQMFKDKDGNTITVGYEFMYFAKEAGTYTVKMRYYGVASVYSTPLLYVNGTSVKKAANAAAGVTEFTTTVELNEGVNNLYLLRGAWLSDNFYPTNQINLYTDYVEITAPYKYITLNAQYDGSYPVKVEYSTDASNKTAITLKDAADKEYKINYPVASGSTEYYVIDMPLKTGANKIRVDSRVSALSIYNGTTRRYEGEELAPASGQKTLAVNGENKLFAQLLMEDTGLTSTDTGVAIDFGDKIKYNAAAKGDYTISIQYYGIGGSYITPRVRLVTKDGMKLVHTSGNTCDNSVATTTFTTTLEAGENTILITPGKWIGSNWGDVRQNAMFIDYVDITAPVFNTTSISVAEDGIYPVEINYVSPSNNTAAIVLNSLSGEEYRISYPIANGTAGSYVIDINLKAGENTFIVDERVTSLDIYTKNIRCFEAEELSPDATYRADHAKDGTTFSTMNTLPEEAQIFKDNAGNTVTIGHMVNYYAENAGTYTIKFRYFGYANHYATPLLYINDTATRKVADTANGTVQEYTAEVQLNKGANKIYLLRGAYISGFYPTNNNNLYTDYIKVAPAEVKSNAVAKTSNGAVCSKWSDITTDTFNVYADVENGFTAAKTVTIITAVYEGDKLTAVVPETKEIPAVGSYPYKSFDITKGTNTKAVLYIWDGVTFAPYTDDVFAIK